MKNKKPIILGSLFILYTLLSWVLFFRDERALMVLGERFYPYWDIFLETTRIILLKWKLNTIPTVLFAIVLVAGFYVYFKTLKEKVTVRTAVFWGIVFQIIAFFSYPVLSTDVFSYILSDRVAVVYHQNVWITRPDNYKNDPFFGLADWTDQTRIYGGVNQVFYSLATTVSGDDFFVNLITHKLVVLLFVLGSMAIASRLLSNDNWHWVFWNPLFVIETAGSAHNDILMLFFGLLGIWAYKNKKIFLTGLFLALATQVKSTPLLLAIFIATNYFMHVFSKGETLWYHRVSPLITFLVAYGTTMLGIYYLMGVDIFEVFTRTTGSINVYWQSLPMQVNRFFPAAKPILTAGLLIFLIVQGLRTVISKKDPIMVYAQTLLVYLLFFLAAFWNWYPIWILVLLPVTYDTRLAKTIITFTFSSMFAYVIYWISLRLNYQFWVWPVIMYLTIILPPAGVYIYERISKKE